MNAPRRRQIAHATLSTGLPALAALAGVWEVARGRVGGFEIAVLVATVYATATGIEVGFHRLFSHRAFVARPTLEAALGILGSMAAQGPPIDWAASHRTHHRFSDKPGDLHSPHVAQSETKPTGLFHAHLGWLYAHEPPDYFRVAPDLFKNRALCTINRHYLGWIALGFAIPAAIGATVDGARGALQGALWGGPIRVFVVQHLTFLTNSLCHCAGARDFRTDDRSHNRPFLAFFTLGSALHNTHHAFPSSARLSLLRRHVDPGYWLIALWRRLRWADKVRVPEQADVARRLATTEGAPCTR